MTEEKFRNGLITVRYLPSLFEGKLSKIGYFKVLRDGETAIFRNRPEEGEYYPLYLEIKSHEIFKVFVGIEIELHGHLTITKKDGRIKSGHITPSNYPLLCSMRDIILKLQGRCAAIEELKAEFKAVLTAKTAK